SRQGRGAESGFRMYLGPRRRMRLTKAPANAPRWAAGGNESLYSRLTRRMKGASNRLHALRGSAGQILVPETRHGLGLLYDVNQHARGVPQHEPLLPPGLGGQTINDRRLRALQPLMLLGRILDLKGHDHAAAIELLRPRRLGWMVGAHEAKRDRPAFQAGQHRHPARLEHDPHAEQL